MLKGLKYLVAVAAAALALNANAQSDQFLLIDGIPGESDDAQYGGSIDVLSWSWNLSQSGTKHDTLANPGKVSFADTAFTKHVDASSVKLYRHVTDGSPVPFAVLKIRKPGEEPFNSEELVMYDVLVTSVDVGGSAGHDRLTESLTLNFRSFCIRYTERLPTGSPGAKPEFCWNIAAGEACTAAQAAPLTELRLARSLPMETLLRMNPVCTDTKETRS